MRNSRASHGITRRNLLRATGGGIALGALTLAGCAPSGGGGGESTGALQISSWFFAQEPHNRVLRDLLAQYTKSKGVEFEPLGVTFNDYLNQLILRAKAGQISGLVQVSSPWMKPVSELDVLMDLSEAAQGMDYLPYALKLGTVSGKVLGLPTTAAAIGMAGNAEVLRRAGVATVPKTVDELERAMLAVQKWDSSVYAYGIGTLPSDANDFIPWMWQFGSPVMADGEIHIGDDQSVAAFTWLKSLYDRKLIPPGLARADARTLFAQGKLAFYEDAIQARKTAIDNSKNESFREWTIAVPRPGLSTGDRPYSQLQGYVMCVMKGGRAQEAVEFAKWITSDPTAQRASFEGLGLPPATNAGLALDAVAKDKYTTTWTNEVTAQGQVVPFAAYAQSAKLTSILGQAVQQIFNEGADPRRALNVAAAAMREAIK